MPGELNNPANRWATLGEVRFPVLLDIGESNAPHEKVNDLNSLVRELDVSELCGIVSNSLYAFDRPDLQQEWKNLNRRLERLQNGEETPAPAQIKADVRLIRQTAVVFARHYDRMHIYSNHGPYDNAGHADDLVRARVAGDESGDSFINAMMALATTIENIQYPPGLPRPSLPLRERAAQQAAGLFAQNFAYHTDRTYVAGKMRDSLDGYKTHPDAVLDALAQRYAIAGSRTSDNIADQCGVQDPQAFVTRIGDILEAIADPTQKVDATNLKRAYRALGIIAGMGETLAERSNESLRETHSPEIDGLPNMMDKLRASMSQSYTKHSTFARSANALKQGLADIMQTLAITPPERGDIKPDGV